MYVYICSYVAAWLIFTTLNFTYENLYDMFWSLAIWTDDIKVENEASIIAYLSVITIMNYVFLWCSYVYAHAHAGV